MRVFSAPKLGRGNVKSVSDLFSLLRQARRVDVGALPVRNDEFQFFRFAQQKFRRNFAAALRLKATALQICAPRVLYPDGFPDSRRLHIPAIVIFRFRPLFAAQLGFIQTVQHFDGELVFPRLCNLRNIQTKMGKSALVFARETSVHIDERLIVHRFEMKQNPSRVFFEKKRPLVPHAFVNALVAYPARPAFVAVRDNNFFVKGRRFALSVGKSEIPFPAQKKTVFPFKLRIRAAFAVISNFSHYPLIPPMAIPLIKYFCPSTKIRRMGRAESTAPAICFPY